MKSFFKTKFKEIENIVLEFEKLSPSQSEKSEEQTILIRFLLDV